MSDSDYCYLCDCAVHFQKKKKKIKQHEQYSTRIVFLIPSTEHCFPEKQRKRKVVTKEGNARTKKKKKKKKPNIDIYNLAPLNLCRVLIVNFYIEKSKIKVKKKKTGKK